MARPSSAAPLILEFRDLTLSRWNDEQPDDLLPLRATDEEEAHPSPSSSPFPPEPSAPGGTLAPSSHLPHDVVESTSEAEGGDDRGYCPSDSCGETLRQRRRHLAKGRSSVVHPRHARGGRRSLLTTGRSALLMGRDKGWADKDSMDRGRDVAWPRCLELSEETQRRECGSGCSSPLSGVPSPMSDPGIVGFWMGPKDPWAEEELGETCPLELSKLEEIFR